MAVEMFSWLSFHERMPDVGIELGAACMPSGRTSNRTTAPGFEILDIASKAIILSSQQKQKR